MICRAFLADTQVGLVALVAILAVGGCGGSDAPDAEGSAGTTNDGGGGAGNEGGTEDVGGDTSTGDDDDEAAGGSGTSDGFVCENYPAPGAIIADFSAWNSDGTWGDATSLTGGSFFYDSISDDDVAMLTAEVEDEVLTLTGEVESYAGFGLWFGPCLDATVYSGISFTISGDLGNTQIEFQVQSSSNYPIDEANSKGMCTGTWSDGCASNKVVLELESPAESVIVELPWADIAEGMPTSPVDPTELLGLQWQFNCASGDSCTPNVQIDDVVFYLAE